MGADVICNTVQDADAGRPQPTGLPSGCERGHATLHDTATAGRTVRDAVLSRRRPLGAETAELSALVQDGECMVWPLDAILRQHQKVTRWAGANNRRSHANL